MFQCFEAKLFQNTDGILLNNLVLTIGLHLRSVILLHLLLINPWYLKKRTYITIDKSIRNILKLKTVSCYTEILNPIQQRSYRQTSLKFQI